MDPIQMVDLKGQYQKIKQSVNSAIQECIDATTFINGPQVDTFRKKLEKYLDVKHVVPCANGTDALQIALMSLDLQPGDEVIVPCFTYAAAAEAIALLKLKPVPADVDPRTFNITAEAIRKVITARTKAIIPVHLFGQCAPMEEIMEIAHQHHLFVIEDVAQAIGVNYFFSNGKSAKAGTIGHIGCTSFFPSKNLGCYGDGGALYTNNDELAIKIKKIANHGQAKKYEHELVGMNSRLDSIQAAILSVKLDHLNEYVSSRKKAAAFYDEHLKNISWLSVPERVLYSEHVFHQYTITLHEGADRDSLKKYLEQKGIPSMVYYPKPLHLQQAYNTSQYSAGDFPVTEKMCNTVLSLPMHTELTNEHLQYITDAIINFRN